MPAGRPTVLTKAVQDKIVEMLFLAFNDSQIALVTGVSDRTVRKARLGELFPEISKAALEREMPYRKRVWDGTGNWCGAAWMLERKYPSQFAKPEIQLSFNNSYTQNNLTINLTSAEAKEIEKEANPIREKITGMFKQYRPQLGNGDAYQRAAKGGFSE